jgi:hypothetical protein
MPALLRNSETEAKVHHGLYRPHIIIIIIMRHHLDALFLTQVYFGLKFCHSILKILGLRVPARNIRDFAFVIVCSSCKNCPSAGCAAAANVICRDVDVFGVKNILINHIVT